MAGCITSCSAGGYGPSTRNPLPPHRGCHQSGFPGWCNSARSQPFIRFWGTEITYIPLRKGFLYLVAIMDMFSKDVLSGKISNSWDTQFCMDALEMTLASGSRPEICHSDQSFQFTSADYMAKLQGESIRISWPGRRCCINNILFERLWRTVKYEEVYLRVYIDGRDDLWPCKTPQFPGGQNSP